LAIVVQSFAVNVAPLRKLLGPDLAGAQKSSRLNICPDVVRPKSPDLAVAIMKSAIASTLYSLCSEAERSKSLTWWRNAVLSPKWGTQDIGHYQLDEPGEALFDLNSYVEVKA
jgi:hypothetical protein